MRVSKEQVLDFARWTGDCNPIHVDPIAAKESAFGGNICHGMLVLIESLAVWDLHQSSLRNKLESVEVQFRSEVRPDSISQVQFQKNDTGITGKVSSGDLLQMELVARWKTPEGANELSPQMQDFSWMQTAISQGVVTSVSEEPQPWTTEDFRPGDEILGVHRFAEHQPTEQSKFSLVEEQVFGLCSFIVGMRVPGLSSLFTRLKTTFVNDPIATEELIYRLTLQSYDDNFRILEMRLDVATSGMEPVAVCEIQCYVRFPKLDPQVAVYDGDVPEAQKQAMSGKVALVCGASRGLGAEIAAALAAVDCISYLASRSRSKNTDALVDQIQQRGGKVHVLLGDVGDPKWCKATAEQLQREHGRLDLLILNACELPELKKIAEADPLDSANYIHRNVALYQQPLMHLLGLVKKSTGTIVAISSSAVDEIPAGFGDYVSVKLALEGSIRTVSKENSNLRSLIVRPPQLQTPWNDTPIRAVGSVSVSSVASEILCAVSQDSWDKNLKILSTFPRRKQIKKRREIESELALVASFTLDPIHQGFQGWSEVLDLGIEPQVAPYAQVLQQALDPSSIASRSISGSVFLVRLEDFFHELPEEILSSREQVQEILKQNVSELVEAMKSHRATAKGPTLLLLCPSFVEPPIDLLFKQSEGEIQDSLKGVSGLSVWRADAFHSMYRIDSQTIQDRLRNTIGHIPFVDAYYDFLATLCVRHLTRRLQSPKKVVVLDCDNTLWRGVVGEVGPEGISFEPAHHRLHEKLGQLSDSGMLLCLCSKNEPEDVWAVFDQRADFGLKRNQIVASKINWVPKGQNIQELARSLNLGLDSFVFLDDNPVECAEVRASCPTVLTLQWYHDNATAERLIDHLWELDIHATTKEDRERTRMYREEFQRQEVQANASNFQAFIDSLELVVEFNEITEEFLQRASQLTLRTNQFNFSTIRRNESEILELQKNPQVDMRIVQVRDRFGEYGIVGLLIATEEPNDYTVDTFLLSCRVLGRGVEHRIASYIASLAQQRGHSAVRWVYKPTEKNAPARLFLQKITGDQTLEAKPTEISIPIERLLGLRFQTDPSAEPVEESKTEEAKGKKGSNAYSRKSVRLREQQVKRIVEELSDSANISKAFRNDVQVLAVASFSNSDVEDRVIGTFASVLGIEPEKVKNIDRLDALGCDSLQIVSITVSLTKVFPQLPPTLLFEYRSISEIIEQISRICTPSTKSSQDTQGLASVKGFSENSISAKIDSEIAIVGLGMLSAAGQGQDAFWNCLLQHKSMVTPLPTKRDGYIGEVEFQHPYYGSLMPCVTGFDPEFFGISPREAQYMDPQMRTVLQSAWHALEDAGSWKVNFDRSMGVFVGVMYQCYGRVANRIATENASVYRCWEGFGVANRLSQILGVSGPSLAIDTACSSSATALHYAVESLRSSDCNSALVCGVNLILDPGRIAQLDNLGILTRTGKCVPFGDQADGTVIGEGAVAVVIKRLSDALKDSDRIYAVIKGSGLSVGAGSVGFTAPNPVAQALAIRAAIADAHVDPRTIGYVETHGTGTQLGDPIEVRGLEMAYCDESLWDQDIQCQAHTGIGSIKPNIGHLEAGAGLAGVVKAALQLHHRMLLPSITSQNPNPQIPFDKLPFQIQREAKVWEPLKVFRTSTQSTEILPRRAAVNSFGVGGSNAHIVLEEAPSSDPSPPCADRSAHLLTLQAPTPEGLRLQAASWSDFLKNQNSHTIGDALYSNLVGRKNFEYKGAFLIDDFAKAPIALKQWSQGDSEMTWGNHLWTKSNRIAYLFTGQGAQYPGMFYELYLENPLFKQALDQCSQLIDPKLKHSILKVLFEQSVETDSLIHQTRYTQPAIFVVQYALFKLLESYGIEPGLVLGHSIGEIAAYCVTGGCSLADAMELVRTRGELMQNLPAGGGMGSAAASAECVEEILRKNGLDLSIAAYNGPTQTVVSGTLQEIEVFSNLATAQGIKTQTLKVSHAFHSKLMEPMLEEFRAIVSKLGLGVPQKEFISTVTAQSIQKELATCDYWVEQVRKPVRFMQAMETAATNQVSHFLEVGPHPVLTTLARSIDLPNTDDSTRWLSCARRGQSNWSVLLPSIGQLFVDGYPIDWARAEAPYKRHRVSVPGYAFSNRRIWLDEIDQIIHRDSFVGEGRHATPDETTRLEYHVRWKQSELLDSSPSSVEEKSSNPIHWLILSIGDSSMAKGLEAIVRQHGDLPRLVSWDMQIQQWGLAASDLMEHQRLVLVAGDDWSDLTHSTDVQSRCEEQIDAFSKALALARQVQNLKPNRPETRKAFWLLTTGAGFVNQTPFLSPIASTLWGGAKVASMELPELWGGAIDSKNTSLGLESAYKLMAMQTSEDQIIVSDSGAWVPRLESLDLTSSTENLPLGRSVLITGGLGAIGLRLAHYAVSQGASQVFLVGRSAQPSPEQMKQLDELSSKGVSIELISADVANQQGIRKLEQSLHGKKIETVFHTAGVDFLSPIADWTRDDIHRVTQAKIQGAWNLHQWSLNQPIKRFVLTSSIASVWGAPSRFLYASANAFLDALGSWRSSQNLPVTVLNFGPWSQGGMADEASLAEYLRAGMKGLDPQRTIQSVGRLVSQGISSAVVTDTQWDRFASVVSARRERPFFEVVLQERPLSVGNSKTNQTIEPWISKLSALDPIAQEKELVQMVRKEFSEVIKSQEERIPLDRNLYRLGLDSITAVELSMRIKKGTGIASGKWLSGEPTIESLAKCLLGSVNSKVSSVLSAQSLTSADRREVAPWASSVSKLETQNEKREHLLGLIRQELERFIGKDASKVNDQTPPKDLGLDSLATVDFAAQLRRQLGLASPPRLMQYAKLDDWISTVVLDTDQATKAVGEQEVVMYESSMHQEVMEFCSLAWPNRDAKTMHKRWDWMFLESAKRVGESPKVWLARDSGRMVGHMGAQFARLKLTQDEITCAWFVDTMVLDAYRPKGVGAQILLEAEENMPMALSLGQTAEVRRILDSLGWKRICPLKIHMFMNRPQKVFKGKLPMGADWIAAGYFGSSASRRSGLQGSKNPKICLRKVKRFDSTHDGLWSQMRQAIGCSAVRDSSYLNWKYIEQPGQCFDCWEVMHCDKLIGVIVTKTEEPSKAYSYRRLHWVDLVCSLEPDVLDLVIHGCIAKSTELGVDAISVQLTNETIERRLIAKGFVSRPETRYLYASKGLIDSIPHLLSSNWLVTQGDSDIDRPQ